MSGYPISDDKLPLYRVSPFHPAWVWNIGPCEDGRPCTVYSFDKRGAYVIQFKCAYRNGQWTNAASGEKLLCTVEGWR